jgi:hypothetical protein
MTLIAISCDTPAPLLAATDLGTALTIGLWIMLAAVLAIGGIYAALAVKRWVQRDEPVEVLTLQDLREMQARGQITEKEYEILRAGILGSVEPSADTPPDPEQHDPPA